MHHFNISDILFDSIFIVFISINIRVTLINEKA